MTTNNEWYRKGYHKGYIEGYEQGTVDTVKELRKMRRAV